MPSASAIQGTKELRCKGTLQGRVCGKLLIHEGNLQCPRCKEQIAADLNLAEQVCPVCSRTLAKNGTIKCLRCKEIQITEATKMLFSIGSLTATSIEAVRFWLCWMVGLLDAATMRHDSDVPLIDETKRKVLAVIENLQGRPGELEDLFEVFKSFTDLLVEIGGSNPIICRTMIDSCCLIVDWNGSWTENRFVMMTVPLKRVGIEVKWDTGTGKESQFLCLPSMALEFASGDKTAKIENLGVENPTE